MNTPDKLRNPCMSAAYSCSACCGLYNLDMTVAERRQWLAENTTQFMALDLSQSENIVRFRKERESLTLPQRVREDIYVCPFIGFVDEQTLRTGCLLHPKGSPHRQIGLLPHPQNFSFYGEGICLAYDCLAKERSLYRNDFFSWAKSVDSETYGRLACDHTLHRALATLLPQQGELSAFYDLIARAYARYRVVTTSFEDIEKHIPDSVAALCYLLAERVAQRRCALLYKKQSSHRSFSVHFARLLLNTLRGCLKEFSPCLDTAG